MELADPMQLPPYSWLVRRRGRAVAAYRHMDDAEAHADTVWQDGGVVDWDRCTGLKIPPAHRLWREDVRTRQLARAEVERLAAAWLAGCNGDTTEPPAVPGAQARSDVESAGPHAGQ